MSERPAFDPRRVRVPKGERGRTSESALSVHAVNLMVRDAINRGLPQTLHVVGELGNLSRPASGHLYFTLKDSQSELRCVMWRSSAAKLSFDPEPGLELICTGSLEVYLPRGTYQLMVRKLEPRGVGALEIAFRQLREKLEQEGLFDPGRKKPLPRYPQRIALITSPHGAAIRDVLQTLSRRYPVLSIYLFAVPVQGEEAAPRIAQAIREVNRAANDLGGLDLAILTRGGGSLEDLWAFNEEVVARAIAASRVPIVSAVGHEVDVTISDLVADLRAPTPTAAAELITPELSDVLLHLERQADRLTRDVERQRMLGDARLRALLAYEGLAKPVGRIRQHEQWVDEAIQTLQEHLRRSFDDARQRLSRVELATIRYGSGADFARRGQALERLQHRLQRAVGRLLQRGEVRMSRARGALERRAPSRRIDRLDEQLSQFGRRLRYALRTYLARAKTRLQHGEDAARACSPERVLKRGYSVTRDHKTKKVIRSEAEVREGDRVVTQLADGEFPSIVEDPRQPRLF